MKKNFLLALSALLATFAVVSAQNQNPNRFNTQLIIVDSSFYDVPTHDPDGEKTELPKDAVLVPEGIANQIRNLTLEQIEASDLPKGYEEYILRGSKKQKTQAK